MKICERRSFCRLRVNERGWVATKLFGTSHRIGWEDDTQTIVTMDPTPKTIELRANKIQWNIRSFREVWMVPPCIELCSAPSRLWKVLGRSDGSVFDCTHKLFWEIRRKCYSLKDLNFNVLAQQTTSITSKGILYTSYLDNCCKT